MSVIYTFPTSIELSEIEQSLLPTLTEDDPVFDILPLENEDADVIAWEQEDDFIGLQNVRGLNGQPARVVKTGFKRYEMKPGVYGEMAEIDEADLTKRRQIGQFGPIDLTDLVRREQDRLLHRRLMRIKTIGWTLLTSGTFSVSNDSGSVTHTDSYNVQTFSAATAWSTHATSTPLGDLRTAQLLQHGFSVVFDATSTCYMNRTTWNNFIGNTNAADLFGRRTTGLATYENIGEVNKLLSGDDLPQIKVYDHGYKNSSGTFVTFIPNNTAVIVGKRTDKRPIGSYCMTRNANNPDLGPGSYVYVVDSLQTGSPVPRKVTLHDGHNGGPKMLFPSAVVVMSV